MDQWIEHALFLAPLTFPLRKSLVIHPLFGGERKRRKKNVRVQKEFL